MTTGCDDTSRRRLEDLKISVLATGVRAEPRSIGALSESMLLTTHEYPTTGGLACRVGDVYLNAPFDEWFCDEADVRLEGVEGAAVLLHGGEAFEISEIFPVPSYVGQADSQGRPLEDVVFSHLDRVRLSPIVGCAYDCAFCDLPGRIHLRPLDQLREAAALALADRDLPIRHLLISGGSPGPRQQQEFADTVVELVRHFSAIVEVDVMMSSGSDTVDLVGRLADAGVHGLSLNLELYSAPASEIHIRAKHRRARPHLEATLSRAVELLGRDGRVRSLIIPGLEPIEDTMAGVEFVASMGADPVLSPFRPASGIALERHRPCTALHLRAVLDEARAIVARYGVRLGPRCLPCQHNTLAYPWDVDDGA